MITRFAPSPTGPLHLGHAFSALTAFECAQTNGGTFLLRIEDIDQSRARAHWEQQIFDDLAWLGLSWAKPVRRQSDHMADYAAALDHLWAQGWLYPCQCSRADIRNALSAPQEGVSPPTGPDGLIYPGTCRPTKRCTGSRPEGVTLRLDVARAMADRGLSTVRFCETGVDARDTIIPADEIVRGVGDIVLARRDMGTSYHLSVVVDDGVQGITHVVRGADLAEATVIHVLLQRLLGLPTPVYHHHRLIRDETGKRLAKRDDARALSRFRDEGATPSDIRNMVGLAVAS